MINNLNIKTMENQNQIWDQLVSMRDELELTEGNEELLETIFYILDRMRGGYDVTEEAMCILENA